MSRTSQRQLGDNVLRQFGNIAGVMGWIMLVGIAGSAICVAATTGAWQ